MLQIKWTDEDPETEQRRFLCAERFAGVWRFKWKLQRRGDWTKGLEPTRAMWEHVLDSLQRRYRRREGVSDEDVAQVEKILKEYPDGRMDILTRGLRRFEIVMLNDERNYLRGTVEFFDDEQFDPVAPDIQQRAIEGYNELQALSSNRPLESSESHNPQLSFQLAQPVPDVTFRQVLLATRSESPAPRSISHFPSDSGSGIG